MNIFSRYFAYLRHNPQGYWFKRKAYGWGWVPATWQGWVSVAVMVAVFVWILVPFMHDRAAGSADVFPFVVKIVVWAVAVLLISYFKGEPPKWQWGIPDVSDRDR